MRKGYIQHWDIVHQMNLKHCFIIISGDLTTMLSCLMRTRLGEWHKGDE